MNSFPDHKNSSNINKKNGSVRDCILLYLAKRKAINQKTSYGSKMARLNLKRLKRFLFPLGSSRGMS